MYRGYCAEKGIALKEVWFSRRQENMKIAIYERSNVYRENQTADFEAERIVPEERVYDELTALLKHAENILRSKEGNSSRVQVQENVLPKEFLELMEVQLTSRFTKVQAGSNKSGTRIPLPQKRIERRIPAILETDDDVKTIK